MKRFLTLLAIPFFIPLFITACGDVAGTSDGDVTVVKNYDAALLAEYRAILPSSAAVEVKAPEASGTRTVGEPAAYPQQAHGIVAGVNGAVKGIIDLMELIVAIEPTFYNSETLEFVWGPWENNDEGNDDFGWTMVYIRDNGAETDKDFRYDYALLKGVTNDLATMTPVIWGASDPDPENDDYGSGITMWDFEAMHDFALAHDPNYDTKAFDRGRFLALYSAGADVDADTGEDAEAAFVVSVFRNFIPKDKPLDPAVNADYYYGRWATSEVRFDILDFEFQGDVDEDDTVDTEALEDVGVWMVFINESLGRAEAFSSGGDWENDQWLEVVECWDTSINQLALHYTLCDLNADDGSCDIAGEHDEAGSLNDCIDPFKVSLEELNLPSLQTIAAENPGMLEALGDVAENGIPTDAEPEASESDAQ